MSKAVQIMFGNPLRHEMWPFHFLVEMLDLHLSNFPHVGRTFCELHSFWIYICRISLISHLQLSNFAYFRLTFAQLHLFWTHNCRAYLLMTHICRTSFIPNLFWTHICRTSLILDVHLSNFLYFSTYICRTSLILDLHLSNFTYFGPTFVERQLF